MNFHDFQSMFISVHICKFHDEYNFNFLRVREKPQKNLDETQNDNLDESQT